MKIYNQELNKLYLNNENGDSGFYPIGNNGFWHSGIHLQINDALTPVIEGDLVAYRINEDYEIYEKNIKKKNITEKVMENFSSNFVLLKHNIDINMNKKKSTITFFSMYMSLLPDKYLEIVKQYSDDFHEIKENKKLITPFYRTWEFKINPNKAITQLCYDNNENLLPHSKGRINDNNYLTIENNDSLKCKMDNGSDYTIAYNYLSFLDDRENIIVRLLLQKDYLSDNDFSKRGVTKAVEVTAYCKPLFKNNEAYLLITANAKCLEHNAQTGYVFQRQVMKIVTGETPYRNVNTELNIYRVPMYDVNNYKINSETMVICCKYGEYNEKIKKLKNSSKIKLFFSDWSKLTNKEQIISDSNANFKVPNPQVKYDEKRTIIFCNISDYNWLQKDQLPLTNEIYYDLKFSNPKEHMVPYIAYVDRSTMEFLKKEGIAGKLDSTLEVCTIQQNGKYVYSTENMEIKESEDLCLISNHLMHKAKSHLRETVDTQWYVKAKDVILVKGPSIELIDSNKVVVKNKGHSKYTPSKTIGKLYYKENHPYGILSKDSVFEIKNINKDILDSPKNGEVTILFDNKEYQMKINNWNELYGHTVICNNLNVGKSIQKPENMYLTKNDIIGYGSDYDFGDKKDNYTHDLVIFFKDNNFLLEKDEKNVTIAKTEKEVFYIDINTTSIQQRFPSNTVFTVLEEITVFSYKCYKIKIDKVPIYFSNKQVTSQKNKKLQINGDMSLCWIYDCKVEKNSISNGNNFKTNECSILSKILQTNFDFFKNKTYELLNQNSSKTASQVSLELNIFSAEYYIIDTENFNYDKTKKTLTVKTKDKLISLYYTNPYSEKKISLKQFLKSKNEPIKDIEFEHDDGAIIKYNNSEYVAFEAADKSMFINKNDVENKNLYDWSDSFNIQQSSKGNVDDVFCDIKEEILPCITFKDEKEKENFTIALEQNDSIKIAYNNEFDTITRELRKMIVKHPLEWNSEDYKELDVKKFKEHDCIITEDSLNNLKEQMNILSVWNDIKDINGIDNQKTLFFAHPLMFLEHIEKLQDKVVPFLFEKWGDRITSRKGNIFSLDNGKGKLLSNVEWYSQRDNIGDNTNGVYGYNMCQLTSLAMVMNAMGIKRLNAGGQYEDELYSYAKLAGYGGSKLWTDTWTVYSKVLENYPEAYSFIGLSEKDQIVDSIKKSINNGIPMLLSIDYKEDWNHGHVTVAVGYTEKNLIINDPYGNVNTSYNEHNGAFVEYDIKRWFIGQKWAGYLKK